MLEYLAAPTALPVSLVTAKSWLRETSTDYDAAISDLLSAAFEYAETINHNAIVYRPVREQFDSFLPILELSGYPPRGVKSLTYLDTAGVSQTVPIANYLVDVTKGQVRMTAAYALYFPPTRPVMNAVQVTYDIGQLCPITAVDLNADTITAPGANKKAGDTVQLTLDAGDGAALPTGVTAGPVYYALNPTAGGDTFQLSLTSGGAAIDLSGSYAPAKPAFVGVMPARWRAALSLIMNTWYRYPADLTAAQVKQIPVHGVEALLTPDMPRGF